MKVSVQKGAIIFLVSSLVALGALAHAFPAAPPALPSAAGNGTPGGTVQSLTITGAVNVKVYAPGGALVSNWNGPDPLSHWTSPNLIGCILGTYGGFGSPGQPSTPNNVPGCSSWINNMVVMTDNAAGTCTAYSGSQCAPPDFSLATNYLMPNGCGLTGPDACTGWESQAIYGPSTFTPSNCGTSCKVEFVAAGTGLTANSLIQGNGQDQTGFFDYICTPAWDTLLGQQPGVGLYYNGCTQTSIATVSPGQTLVVTISYTVS